MSLFHEIKSAVLFPLSCEHGIQKIWENFVNVCQIVTLMLTFTFSGFFFAITTKQHQGKVTFFLGQG